MALSAGWLTPDVRGKVMVVYARRGFSDDSWAGMMSEFHAALGALHYAETQGAAGVRFMFDSTIYVDAERGPSWWSYFFSPDTMWIGPQRADAPEVHLNDWLAKYGRMGGFGHLVYGEQPHLYPMTFGLSRKALHGLIDRHFAVKPELTALVEAYAAEHFQDVSVVIGLHYRGLDTVVHWPYYKVEYEAYIAEVEHVLQQLCPSCDIKGGKGFKIFMATDEIEALEAVRAAFGAELVLAYESPRAGANSKVPLHKDKAIANYVKGESVLVDALLLASTSYIIKGRSSVSEASLVFSEELPYSFFVTRELIYRDTMPSSDASLGPHAQIPKS